MLGIAVYLALAAGVLFFAAKYRETGNVNHLKNAGALVLMLTFPLSITAGAYALLYPGKQWLVYAALLGGSLTGGVMCLRAYAGWKKIAAGGNILAFVLFTAFICSCLGYFEKVIVQAHAAKKVYAAVPAARGFQGLGEMKKLELSAQLRPALESGDKYLRLGALYILSTFGGSAAPAVDKMIPLVNDADPFTRERALAAIAAAGPAAADAAPAVAALLKAPYDYHATERAIEAIAAIGSGAVPALVAVMNGGEREEVSNCALAIAKLGPAAEAAVPDLLRLLGSPEPGVRAKVIRALGAAGGGRREEVLAALAPFTASRNSEESAALSAALSTLQAGFAEWQGYIARNRGR